MLDVEEFKSYIGSVFEKRALELMKEYESFRNTVVREYQQYIIQGWAEEKLRKLAEDILGHEHSAHICSYQLEHVWGVINERVVWMRALYWLKIAGQNMMLLIDARTDRVDEKSEPITIVDVYMWKLVSW